MTLTSFPYPDAPEEDKYSVCVHCGFCLEVCPTYQETSDENHSPRGRVYLIKSAAEGVLPLDGSVVDPVFTCLDCRACETVCPSGVQVGSLIETARGQVHAARQAQGGSSALEALFLRGLFPHPRRLRALRGIMRLYQQSGLQKAVRSLRLLHVLPPHLREMEAVLPDISGRPARVGLPERLPARGEERTSVLLFTGCVMDVFFSGIHEATARVVAQNGMTALVPRDQVCCGALHVHAGDRDQARALARQNIAAFERSGAEWIVVNAAGCGAALKEYPELFHEEPAYRERAERFSGSVRDIAELLVEQGFTPPSGTVERTVAYHDACHLCHAQQIREEPRDILRSIPGLTLVEMPDSERCCGSAGIYNLTHPEMAGALLERKIDDIPADVQAVAMGNPGCMLQIRMGAHRRGLQVDVVHTVQLLDEAYRKEEPAR